MRTQGTVGQRNAEEGGREGDQRDSRNEKDSTHSYWL